MANLESRQTFTNEPISPRQWPFGMHLEGGCLCGSVRYVISGDPSLEETPCLCHCRICQRASGAPAVAWATFAVVVPRCRCSLIALSCRFGAAPEANPTDVPQQDDFKLTKGRPQAYHSTPQGVRQFCGQCGTQLTFQALSRPVLHVTLASLDTADALQPEAHLWTTSKRAYTRTGDLPSFTEKRPT